MPKIPLYIIHGTLGAGKTTILASLLARPEFAGARIVENEFAPQAIDGNRLHHDHPHLNIYEISGECVCCTGSDALMKTLLSLAQDDKRAVPVMVETTGAADAAQLLKNLLLDSDFHDYFILKANILVVDALALHHDADTFDRLASDIALADYVFVTKTDLLSDDDVAAIEHCLKNVSQGKVGFVEQGIVPDNIQFTEFSSRAGETLIALADISENNHDLEWRVFNMNACEPSVLVEALAMARASGAIILRTKGVIHDAQGAAWRIDGTEYVTECSRTENTEAGALVIIGKHLPGKLDICTTCKPPLIDFWRSIVSMFCLMRQPMMRVRNLKRMFLLLHEKRILNLRQQ